MRKSTRPLALVALFLASCGTSGATTSTTSTTSTTEPPEAPVADRFVIDNSSVKASGIDAQWIETVDPDGAHFLCLVVSEATQGSSEGGRGFGLGIHCHERGLR